MTIIITNTALYISFQSILHRSFFLLTLVLKGQKALTPVQNRCMGFTIICSRLPDLPSHYALSRTIKPWGLRSWDLTWMCRRFFWRGFICYRMEVWIVCESNTGGWSSPIYWAFSKVDSDILQCGLFEPCPGWRNPRLIYGQIRCGPVVSFKAVQLFCNKVTSALFITWLWVVSFQISTTFTLLMHDVPH